MSILGNPKVLRRKVLNLSTHLEINHMFRLNTYFVNFNPKLFKNINHL